MVDLSNCHCYSTTIAIKSPHSMVVEEWLSKFNFSYYLLVHEVSSAGTHHYQGCLWCNSELTRKESNRARSFWVSRKEILEKVKKSFSLTACYSTFRNLAFYCLKNLDSSASVLTNLTPDIIKTLRHLPSKAIRKLDLKLLLERKLSEIPNSNLLAFRDWCPQFITCYYEVYNRYPISRLQIYSHGLRCGILSVTSYLEAIGVNLDIDRGENYYRSAFHNEQSRVKELKEHCVNQYDTIQSQKRKIVRLTPSAKVHPLNQKIDPNQSQISIFTSCPARLTNSVS